ncbi:MAG: polysaccharide biosynthesis tyrosine autokinase [Bacteroidetes bacterium]|nr:MAG: polysaccharide biosynthesis tyrosine autokinase [Bacteroidota bacterium]
MGINNIPHKVAIKSNAIVDVKDIKKVIKTFANNWLIIVFCVAISALLAFLYSYKLPRIYGAKMQLLLSSSQTYSYQDKLFEGLGLSTANYERMSNELRVITSTDLLSQTVAKLNAGISYFIVGKVLTKEVYSGTPFLVEAQIYSDGFYEFPFTFKFIDVNSYEISYDENEEKVVKKYEFGVPVINNNYYLLVNKTAAVNPTTVSSFPIYQFVIHNNQNLLYQYKNSIKAENLEYTGILELNLEDESPERAETFLDTLARVYISNSLKTKFTINANTIVFIDKQIREIHIILDSLENMLDSFKEQKDILNLSKEEDTYYRELTSFEAKKRGLEMQLKGSSYLKNYIVSNMNKELLPPFAYIDNSDAYLTNAITKLYDYQVNINSMLFSSTEKSTTVKEMEYKVELLRSDILKYLASSEKAISEKIQAVEEEIAFYEGQLKGVPRNQRQMLNINRKIGVNEKMYLYLLEKRAETIIAKASIISDISIIESPHSIGIVKPELPKIYYTFTSLGLLVSLVIVFLRSILFGSIESVEDMRDLTNLPVVGEVFHAKEAKASYLVVDTQPRSFIAESFRALRTNLEYLSPDVKNKVILITSNSPSAGKTFCSVNLSAILAKGGKKVLLLELDLHKPKIHTALQLKSEIGISTVLIGKCTSSEAVINSQIENLDVILSGPTPPNASELILSDNLTGLLSYAKSKYDYIIIDTPPMGIISDAQVLMKHSNINLFVINSRRGSFEGLQFAHTMIETQKISGSFAFILNSVKPKYSRYYYKGYKYNYGEGYIHQG